MTDSIPLVWPDNLSLREFASLLEGDAAKVDIIYDKVYRNSDNSLRYDQHKTNKILGKFNDVFLTHDWDIDEYKRDNHKRVAYVNTMLTEYGFRTWFDAEIMKGNIQEQMCDGIEHSQAVVVFLTDRYIRKVDGEMGDIDNCKYEFEYSFRRRTPARMLPVVMEPRIRRINDWVGPVQGALGGRMFVDFAKERYTPDEARHVVEGLAAMITKQIIPMKNMLKCAARKLHALVDLPISSPTSRRVAPEPSGPGSPSGEGSSSQRKTFTFSEKEGEVQRGAKVSPMKTGEAPPSPSGQMGKSILQPKAAAAVAAEDDVQPKAAAAAAEDDVQPKGPSPPGAAGKDESSQKALSAALSAGSKEWRRSKIMIVGEGRAGKTALSNTIIGNPFHPTESTVGINELVCNVNYAHTGGCGSQWKPHVKPEKEFEAALAEMMGQAKRTGKNHSAGGGSGSVVDFMQKQYEQEAVAAAAKAVEHVRKVGAALSVPDEAAEAAEAVAPSVSIQSISAATAATATGTAPAADQSVPAVDEELVMKCLAAATETESDLVISVADYGGQSVFNVIHHLFLTRNGVYTLVFNMEWLLADSSVTTQCLDFMGFWLNSIVVHTYDEVALTSAPIVLVGTRKDTISSPAEHERISTVIFNAFSKSRAWPSVLHHTTGRGVNGMTTLTFFPIDNTLGRSDTDAVAMLGVIEESMDAADYTHKEVPLAWLRALDAMQLTKQSCLDIKQIVQITDRCGLPAADVKFFLQFMKEMGIILWHDEPGLGDVVIMDAVAFLVGPATAVICKHIPDGSDPTHHISEAHRECNRRFMSEWIALTTRGILSTRLLPILWKSCADHTDRLVMLMVKFGLLVPLEQASEHSGGAPTADRQFLVPALLPTATEKDEVSTDWSDDPYTSCFFVFSSMSDFDTNTTINVEDLRNYGFLPSGLFERVVGKAIAWCQATARRSSFNLRNVALYKNMAVMAFGNQRFRITACPLVHCIRLDVEGQSPIAVHEQMLEMVRKVMRECMKALHCFSALIYSPTTLAVSKQAGQHQQLSLENNRNIQLEHDAFMRQEGGGHDALLIPLEQLRDAASNHSVLSRPGGRKFMTEAEVRACYGPWLLVFDLLDSYDVFISYRWGQFDDVFVSTLFDMFTNFTVGADNRSITTFLDKKRLRDGRRFDLDFAQALSHSTLAVPVVSADALSRMTKHDPAVVDNVLLEWLVAVECSYSACSALAAVYPVVFGSRTEVVGLGGQPTVEVGNLFAEKTLDLLPDTVPAATIDIAKRMLASNGVAVTPDRMALMEKTTVKKLVAELLKFMCVMGWKVDSKLVVDSSAEKAVDVLRSLVVEVPDQTDAAAPPAVAAATAVHPAAAAVHPAAAATAVHPAAAAAAAAADGAPNFDSVWEILQTPKYVAEAATLAAHIDELGVFEGGDLVDIEPEQLDVLLECLKQVQRKKCFKLLGRVA